MDSCYRERSQGIQGICVGHMTGLECALHLLSLIVLDDAHRLWKECSLDAEIDFFEDWKVGENVLRA